MNASLHTSTTAILGFSVDDLAVRETAELERVATGWPDQANRVCIIGQETYDHAVELLKGIKSLRKEAEAHHRPMIAAAHASHRAACDGLARVDDPLETAEKTIKNKIAEWDREQTRIARAHQEFLRLEAERIQAEQLERELEAMEAAGAKPAEVKAVIQEAEQRPIIVPVVQRTYTPAKGMTATPKWSATVTDLSKLIAHVAAHPELANLLQVNQVALNGMVRAQQKNLNLPGVQVSDGLTIGVR